MNIWNSMVGKVIMTFLISMVPIIELRGAIPIGVASGLNFPVALLTSIIGNLVPIPFIIIFIRKIFQFIRSKSERFEKFVSRIEKRALTKSDVIERCAFWGLFIFVAIPLPGTGAWSAALIAALLEIRLRKAFPAIALGVLGAGVIVSIATYGVSFLF